MKKLIEIKNLVTEFRTKEATTKVVNDISFDVYEGETIGIVGESGSGKSVTSLSIMGLIPSPPGRISSGSILYHGLDQPIDLAKMDEKTLQKIRGNEISMIFQEPMTSLNPVLTCGDQLMEVIQLHQNVDKNKANEITLDLFVKVKLPHPEHVFESYPHQLSGGQKQRVMIAMAMSCNPKVLIADEPTTALDVTVQRTILNLMEDLQQQHNMGIVFITHDLGVIAELADRVLVMYKGQIVEQGKVLDIFTNPQHPYTKGLLACRPKLDRLVLRLPTISDFMVGDANGEIKSKAESEKEVIRRYEVSKEKLETMRKEIYKKDPILEVKNLCTYFPLQKNWFGTPTSYIQAVNDVSLEVRSGEILGLVGESGCGKTTLGRSILKLIQPSSGQIIYKGKDITTLSSGEMRVYRKKLQIIFQDPYSSLNPRMTIGEAIMEPMRMHHIFDGDKQRKNRVIELLERVNMSEKHFDRYPHEFSGGQRQRLGIARALAVNPEFIICDESVSALDVSVQAQVLNLLMELKEEFGLTYIFISHDLSVVKFMSDRIVVMNKGEIVEQGFAQDIYETPQSDYTKKLIDSIPKGRIEDIEAAIERKKGRVLPT